MGLVDKVRRLLGRDWEIANTRLMEEQYSACDTLLAATTTDYADGARALARKYGQDGHGYMEAHGVILRSDPDDEGNAGTVLVEGNRIGRIPRYVARQLEFGPSGEEPVVIRMFTERTARGLRCEAWYWFGRSEPRWFYSRDHRPPMTPEVKAEAAQRDTERMVEEALEEGGPRADSFRLGMVDGTHYLETVEPIKQLKREDRLEEALDLCMTAIQGAENEARAEGHQPAPWYTEQAAIILRKLKRPDEEKAIIQRWIDACPEGYIKANPDETLVVRLRRIREKENAKRS